MFTKFTLVALLGSVAVSALGGHEGTIHRLVTRQLSSASVPSACQDRCATALNIYNACLSQDLNTCLSVCQADTYSNFIGCFDCIVQETPGVTSAEVGQLNDAITTLQNACSQAGQAVPSTSLAVPGGAASGSIGASSSGVLASLTSGVAFTSASSGIVIATGSTGSVPSITPSAGGGPGPSAAASSAASAASSAAALPTGAAGPVAVIPSLAGMAVGIVGLAAGAAFVL